MDISEIDNNERLHSARLAKIRSLNDDLRRTMLGGRLMITFGVSALGEGDVAALLDLVRRFDRFSPDNDPHGEHDFGQIECRSQRFFWKIDYYDAATRYGSEDPSDPRQTTRVLTVMLAAEW